MVKTKIDQSQRGNQSCGIVKDVFVLLYLISEFAFWVKRSFFEIIIYFIGFFWILLLELALEYEML